MKKRLLSGWHASCLQGALMKRSYLSLPARTQWELMLSGGLMIAILAILLFPNSAGFGKKASADPLRFQVMESDYLQPRVASARHIQALNSAAEGSLSFAGYDEFKSAMRLPRGNAIANVTRFAGPVFSMFGIEFVLRGRLQAAEPGVFLSEKFWETEFSRDHAVVGQVLQINGVTFRIAGVAKTNPSLFGATDVWMPICSRSTMGESPSLRVVGMLLPERSPNLVQACKTLLSKTDERWKNLVAEVLSKPRLLPLERGLVFGGAETAGEMVAASGEAARKQPTT